MPAVPTCSHFRIGYCPSCELEEVKAERDQLQAWGAAVDSTARKLLEDLKHYEHWIDGRDVKANLREALNRTPAQSLNHLKAQALEEAGRKLREVFASSDTADWLDAEVKRLRAEHDD